MTPGTPLGDDEVIPTAIVIKNIPFNVKRETLLDIIVRSSASFDTPRRVVLTTHPGVAVHSDSLRVQLSP